MRCALTGSCGLAAAEPGQARPGQAGPEGPDWGEAAVEAAGRRRSSPCCFLQKSRPGSSGSTWRRCVTSGSGSTTVAQVATGSWLEGLFSAASLQFSALTHSLTRVRQVPTASGATIRLPASPVEMFLTNAFLTALSFHCVLRDRARRRHTGVGGMSKEPLFPGRYLV